MSAKIQIHVPLQPMQEEFYSVVADSPAIWCGYGGSRGGAKSHGLRAVMLIRRLANPRTRGLLMRRIFDQLWENHILPLFEQYPFMRDWYHTGHKELTLPNGSVIKFGYAENPGDINDFQGKQYMDIAIDEATHFTEGELSFLKTCCRWPGIPDAHCKMLLSMNPGGIGHAFVKRIFFDRKYQGEEKSYEYAFVQAHAWDNIEWVREALKGQGLTDADYYHGMSDEQRFKMFTEMSDYGRKLNSLPSAMRTGHLLGRWDAFAGQYFDNFRPAGHVFRIAQLNMPDWLPRWIAIDWGFAHESACYWMAQEGKRTVIYREFVRDRLGPRALAQEISDRSKGERISAVYLSPDAWAKRTTEDSIADQMAGVFRSCGLPPPARADADRIGGWILMYQMLDAGELIIADTCRRLIDNLPMFCRDEDNPEDCVKFEGDDPGDAARYGLKSRLRPRQAPVEERVLAKVTSKDPSIRIIQMQKALHEEAGGAGGIPVPIRRPWQGARWRRGREAGA